MPISFPSKSQTLDLSSPNDRWVPVAYAIGYLWPLRDRPPLRRNDFAIVAKDVGKDQAINGYDRR